MSTRRAARRAAKPERALRKAVAEAQRNGDDPVERAKRAGWKIDPRTEESMRRLPPQSALYDVTGQPPSEVRYVEPDDPNYTVEELPPGALADDESFEGSEPREKN